MRRILFSLLAMCALPAPAVELMKWERISLPVPLNVNQERIVFVDKNVRAGFPEALNGKLRLQSASGAVYLLATEPFAPTRIQLQDKESGELLLLDISASTVPDNTPVKEPIRLVYAGEVTSQGSRSRSNGKTAKSSASTSTGKASTSTSARQDLVDTEDESSPIVRRSSKTPIPVALTRYAAQRLYAPARTVEALPGVQNITHHLAASITTLLPGEPVEITPLAAWQLNGWSVVALKMHNTAGRRVTPDPRQLQGQFYAATVQHSWLGAAGTPEDTTTLYLVMKGKPANAFIPEPTCVRETPDTSHTCHDAAGRLISQEKKP